MKPKVLSSFFFTVLILLFLNQAYCQSGKSIASKGGTVFLHTNLSRYLSGDSILFKAFITNNEENNPEKIGNTLYMAVLDQDGLEVANGKFPVKNGQTSGSIGLSSYLTEGKYLLIACTGLMKSATPEDLFSKVIEIGKYEEQELFTAIQLADSLYKPGSSLIANISFTGKEGAPVPISYSYRLTGASGDIFSGKSKSGKGGSSIIALQLPVFKNEESIKLFVTTSYKGRKKITGIVIPTEYFKSDPKVNPGMKLKVDSYNRLNIRIQTARQQNKQNEKVQVDVIVTDDTGAPVVANLSISASNSVFSNPPLNDDDFFTCSVVKNSSLMGSALAGIEDTIPQILTADKEIATKSESVFSIGLRKLFGGYLSSMVQSPGKQFDVQEKNDLKRIKTKKETKPLQKQEGYSPERTIFDILMQIKPYRMVDSKIIFTSSGVNSINNQDGALIVVDGINSGTDSRILNGIPVADIAKITASTSVMDIQRYTGLNNVGIIEIFTKKGGNKDTIEDESDGNISNSLFWDPTISTNSFGRASISFINYKTSPIRISVAGINSGGLLGSKTIQISNY